MASEHDMPRWIRYLQSLWFIEAMLFALAISASMGRHWEYVIALAFGITAVALFLAWILLSTMLDGLRAILAVVRSNNKAMTENNKALSEILLALNRRNDTH